MFSLFLEDFFWQLLEINLVVKMLDCVLMQMIDFLVDQGCWYVQFGVFKQFIDYVVFDFVGNGLFQFLFYVFFYFFMEFGFVFCFDIEFFEEFGIEFR